MFQAHRAESNRNFNNLLRQDISFHKKINTQCDFKIVYKTYKPDCSKRKRS